MAIRNRYLYYAYTKIFDLDVPETRVVLNDMCKAHGVFNGGFDPDPYLNAFNSGERNAVLRILTFLKLTPEEIMNLSEED